MLDTLFLSRLGVLKANINTIARIYGVTSDQRDAGGYINVPMPSEAEILARRSPMDTGFGSGESGAAPGDG